MFGLFLQVFQGVEDGFALATAHFAARTAQILGTQAESRLTFGATRKH
jgi:hypothetical protein